MAYAVKADLTPRRLTGTELAQLTDDTAANVVDDTVVSDILAEASGVVDSYCRARYAVPLQTSEQVKGLTLDIAEYLLFRRRRRVSEIVQKAYDDAIAFLKDVARGLAGLDQPTGATAQTGSGDVQVTDAEEKFSDDNLDGFA